MNLKFFISLVFSFTLFNLVAQKNGPLVVFYDGNDYGFIDLNGNIIYNGFHDINTNLPDFIRAKKNDSIYIFDKNSFKLLVKGPYKSIESGSKKNNQYIIEIKNKFGVIDVNNKIIIPIIYDQIKYIEDSYVVKLNSRFGILDVKNNIIIPIKYNYIDPKDFKLSFPLQVKLDDDKVIYINEKEKLVLGDLKCDYLIRYYPSFMIVYNNNQGYYIVDNKTQKIIIGPYNDITYYNKNGNDFISARLGDNILIFNSKTFKKVGQYSSFIFNTDSSAILHYVKFDDKVGYINNQGKLAINTIYDDGNNFSEKLTSVQLNDKWGVIDEKNRVVIPFEFSFISKFENGVATFSKTFKPEDPWNSDKETLGSYFKRRDLKYMGLISKEGEILVEPIFEHIWYISDNMAEVIFHGDTNKYLYDFVNKTKIYNLSGTAPQEIVDDGISN